MKLRRLGLAGFALGLAACSVEPVPDGVCACLDALGNCRACVEDLAVGDVGTVHDGAATDTPTVDAAPPDAVLDATPDAMAVAVDAVDVAVTIHDASGGDAADTSVADAGGGCGGDGSASGAGTCALACVATAATGSPGDCPAGRACTGGWYRTSTGVDGSTVCVPFCQADADCSASTPVCNPRTGACGTVPVDLSRRPDGSPCDPTATVPDGAGGAVNVQCRGMCVQSGSRVTQGLCASAIHLTVTRECPDTPASIQPKTLPHDDIGMCMRIACIDQSQCPVGLTCFSPRGSYTAYCDYT